MDISGFGSFSLQGIHQKIFNTFDEDSNGALSAEELAKIPSAPEQASLTDVLTQLDTNGDGELAQAELTAASKTSLSSTSLGGLLAILGNDQTGAQTTLASLLGDNDNKDAQWNTLLSRYGIYNEDS